jgi:hypothetical protein
MTSESVLAKALRDARLIVKSTTSIAKELEPVFIRVYVLVHLYRSLFRR